MQKVRSSIFFFYKDNTYDNQKNIYCTGDPLMEMLLVKIDFKSTWFKLVSIYDNEYQRERNQTRFIWT